ncbi:zonular occludens toxin domain-containing protein [Pectobacterium brasiliense]|uniref:zonular occludens toxin domain-containing protein n=1 Tax=Pectobacterium brasiliense TaxID=180957 RepID=UPI002A8082A6|nr:zonular occludens toxin domain-containing protein [Pectobacterium brasiliense]MDY4367993.1 zonular occludens toxin domain-containing protein [Pectobacterium brasiliense]MDY7057371.1 zonular occludens toxin domain-containing protein [Pectobacterium brasiliense]
MAVYVVTGKLGSGKTLVSVSKIQEKLVRGGIVATNLDLKLHNMPDVGRNAKRTRVIRIPDKPNIFDLQSLGCGNTSYDESDNGLLVLDECGTWFNSRSWADKERQDVINWFLHARKLGWDIIFLIQDISIMDKQARLALAEHVVYCRRTDKLAIPFVGTLLSIIANFRFSFPKVHFGIVKYGDNINSITVDKWVYTGASLYAAYNTKQIFSDGYSDGAFCYLSPYITHGQFSVNKGISYYMRITKIWFRRGNRIFMMASFLALGIACGMYYQQYKDTGESVSVKASSSLSTEKDEALPKLSVFSFSQFGLDASVTFRDEKGNLYHSFDLIKKGHVIEIKNPCRILVKKNNYVQTITCQE